MYTYVYASLGKKDILSLEEREGEGERETARVYIGNFVLPSCALHCVLSAIIFIVILLSDISRLPAFAF